MLNCSYNNAEGGLWEACGKKTVINSIKHSYKKYGLKRCCNCLIKMKGMNRNTKSLKICEGFVIEIKS